MEYSMDMITNLDRNMRNFAQDAEIKLRPLTINRRFFDKHGCDSAEMRQLKANLTRAGLEQPSLQQRREGLRNVSPGNELKPPQPLFTFYGDYHGVFAYANPPAGWRPQSPQALQAQIAEQFGPTIRTSVGGKLRQGVDVRIDGAAYGSLKSMVLGWLRGPPSRTSMIWIWEAMRDKKLTGPNENQQMYVECRYRGGGYYIYWYQQTPKGFSHDTLRASNPEHPMLAVQPPRDHCPKSAPTQTYWEDYVIGG